MISDDDDNPIWTKADFARARGSESMTEAELAAFPNTKRIGRPPKDSPKVAVSLRLDSDVVEHFKATGAGWQTRINTALRDVISMGVETLDLGRRPPSAEQEVHGKQAFVTEEIAVIKGVGQRTEEVRDTVRHTEVEVEHVSSRPKRGARTTLQRER